MKRCVHNKSLDLVLPWPKSLKEAGANLNCIVVLPTMRTDQRDQLQRKHTRILLVHSGNLYTDYTNIGYMYMSSAKSAVEGGSRHTMRQLRLSRLRIK